MAIVKTKSDNVKLKGLTPAMAWMLYTIEQFCRTITLVDEIIITSINDSTHGSTSRHYRDEAIDIRSKNFPSREEKRWFREALQVALGSKFRVLLEVEGTPNEHFHCQVRKGMTYP
jgi:hypothetical protein